MTDTDLLKLVVETHTHMFKSQLWGESLEKSPYAAQVIPTERDGVSKLSVGTRVPVRLRDSAEEIPRCSPHFLLLTAGERGSVHVASPDT